MPRANRISLARLRPLLLAATVTAAMVAPAAASRVRPLNLEEITRRAERIFSGRCTDVRRERDPGLGIEVSVVTLRVDHAVKGRLGRNVTVRSLDDAGSSPGEADAAGVPFFRPGEEVIVFLYPESSAGLTSPVGLGQGKFTVLRDKHGARFVFNKLGNRGLFRGLSAQAARRIGQPPPESERRGLSADALLRMATALSGDAAPGR